MSPAAVEDVRAKRDKRLRKHHAALIYLTVAPGMIEATDDGHAIKVRSTASYLGIDRRETRKALTDALSGVVYGDDQQLADERYCRVGLDRERPRCEVHIADHPIVLEDIAA